MCHLSWAMRAPAARYVPTHPHLLPPPPPHLLYKLPKGSDVQAQERREMWARSLERAWLLEAMWLVVTPPCPDVRLGQGLCRGRGGQPLRGTQRNLLLVNLHLRPQPPRPGKRPESWSFRGMGSLGGRRTCLRNAGPSRLGGLWAPVLGKSKCPS